jgi:putative FmdB family regulatory protein
MFYEYSCKRCGEVVTLQRTVAARDDTKGERCPSCNMPRTLTRRMSNPAVHFVGPGFTRTPAIMKDPIAANSPMQGTNWGTMSERDLRQRTGQSDDD